MKRNNSRVYIMLLLSLSFLVLIAHNASQSDKGVEEALKTNVASKPESGVTTRPAGMQEDEIEMLYRDIHFMANTLVVSENGFYYAYKEITRESLASAIEKANRLPLQNKEKILEILTRWQKKDYSHAVEDHNLVNGDSEKATKLKPELNRKVD